VKRLTAQSPPRLKRHAQPQVTPLPMIEASARLDAVGRALAYPIMAGMTARTEALTTEDTA
jgi:hypothetical protein